ncbi:MAG: N-acetyl sugar amidotransferase [SAR324 cluster bacterium]|nr:N-acetyl sugar amidotransferase [SAR324 cluster bacterium]
MEICSRCVLDTSIPNIRFDQSQICNFCHSHDLLLISYPQDEAYLKSELENLVLKIKKQGFKKPYDCIVGLSGGTDSTYTLWLTKQLGLRPLAVHLDDGWNSNIAVTNIKNATQKLGVDLHTHVLDWDEMKSIQVAWLKASLPDACVPTDLAIHGALYKSACQENLKFILGGQSFMTEGTQPREWSYIDGTYLSSINKAHNNNRPLHTIPNASIYKIGYYTFIKRIRQIPLLNYVKYTKEDAKKIIANELDWQDYGGHHYESKWTQFIVGFYNLKKFNIDRRKVSLSGSIRMGNITRDQALQILKEPPEVSEELVDFCIKKVGLSREEWNKILTLEPKNFLNYHSSYQTLKRFSWILRLAVKMDLVTPVLYEKYLG